jgi:hypothetical protein
LNQTDGVPRVVGETNAIGTKRKELGEIKKNGFACALALPSLGNTKSGEFAPVTKSNPMKEGRLMKRPF